MGVVDILDLVLFILIVAAGLAGYRRGVLWVSLSITSLLLGLFLATLISPPLAQWLTGFKPSALPIVALVLFFIIVVILQSCGATLGAKLRSHSVHTKFALTDSLFGSGIAVAGVLFVVWILGLSFAHSQWQLVDSQISNSRIVHTLATIAPLPPPFLLSIANALSNDPNPTPFAAIIPLAQPAVTMPKTIATPGVAQAEHVTAKVIAEGCHGITEGSTFPISTHYFLTNAHVVAGSGRVTLDLPGGTTDYVAHVVLYDPKHDIAILYLPELSAAPLAYATSNPVRGTVGAVIGYPNGGVQSTVPAAIRNVEDATGEDLYKTQYVTRSIEDLQAVVIPGNSGGPLVNLNGTVIGVVFATSVISPTEAYALSPSAYVKDLQVGLQRTKAVSTEYCLPS